MYKCIVIVLLFAILVNARPQGPPPLVDGVPSGFAEVLSSDVIQQLKDVNKNQGLSMKERKEAIDKIMDTVDPATRAKLPKPPGPPPSEEDSSD
ncbi:hypothetical protein DdX_17881 [Ditylenchus destructor]|uniref:Uncharacterized protein n=1 Tax=Ditylenchus destructor TaxID=166010 RepID=A0AAD4QYM2_9BILA|nr:hypothetical protein DdX_17881 [Ditylenchus destructor]